MNEQLDLSLKAIKAMEDEKILLDEKIKEERQKVFAILETEKLKQYKNPELATVSYVQRQTVKYQDRDAVLQKLISDNLPKYYDVIPERKEINKTFENDVKNGVIEIDGVDIETKFLPQIRFIKQVER